MGKGGRGVGTPAACPTDNRAQCAEADTIPVRFCLGGVYPAHYKSLSYEIVTKFQDVHM